MLRVISENYSIYKPKPNPVEVQMLIGEFLLNEFGLSINISGEMANEITMLLRDAFTDKGYSILLIGDKVPDVKIQGDMHIRKMPARAGRWVILNWRFDLNFIKSGSEEVILSYTIQNRQQQPSVEMAKARILYHFRNEYVEEIVSKFKKKLM